MIATPRSTLRTMPPPRPDATIEGDRRKALAGKGLLMRKLTRFVTLDGVTRKEDDP
jgi:hypothetical protein